jgi:omega-6 fatty acid desaturase (delta-12 desaturase)
MGLLNVKSFIIFHDCGHNSYTPNIYLNKIISHILGIVVFTNPLWIQYHDIHHRTNGNIENNYHYKFNELVFTTLQKYKKLSTLNKYIYKIAYNPVVFFTVMPSYFFFVLQRYIYFVKHFRRNNGANKKTNVSNAYVLITHVIHNTGVAFLCYTLFKQDILLHYLVSIYIGSAIGFLLFFNQHTFNPSYVVTNENWNMKDSGLLGSSFIQIPYLLKYFTGGIEYHHIHHINAKIPGYNLQAYHEEVVYTSNMFDNIIKLSMTDCYNNLFLILYDEENNKYITIEEADKRDTTVE